MFKKTLLSTSLLSLVSAGVTAGLAVLPASRTARADSENPISTGATIVLGSTLLIGQMTGNAFTSSSEGTTGLSETSESEKRALAAAALEDAALFYSTGEFSGILPATVERIRELVPEAQSLTDSQIVDVIVESADQLLASLG